jgi:spore photoproduct lyase
MVYYRGWDRDYPKVASMLMERFKPEEVLFISFGSVTLIKPVIDKIRRLGNPTRMLQMELVPDPLGKLTYPDEKKVAMFRRIHGSFRPWHESVFMYLCMEKASIWQETFGRVYENNEEFETELAHHAMSKCGYLGAGIDERRSV